MRGSLSLIVLTWAGCGVAAAQATPAPTAAPAAPTTPAAPTAPGSSVPDFQDAVYENLITCSPNADSDYCSNVADKFYMVRLNGKEYALVPGYNYKQWAEIMAAEVASPVAGAVVVMLLHPNVLGKQEEKTPVQMRFHARGVDVRVLKETKQGTQKYFVSHYFVAKKVPMEPTHSKPK